MSNGKTPQTEAQTLELLNASITRETVRGAVENFLGASKEAAKQDAVAGQNAITFESGDLDTVEFWTRAATRACEMLNKRSEQLREMTAERDALKAREEMAQTSLRLALSGMKQQNEQREAVEATLELMRIDLREAQRHVEYALRHQTAREAAVSDAGPANDVALKVTE